MLATITTQTFELNTHFFYISICNRTVIQFMIRDVFQAISDPVRRDIIELLAKGNLSVNEVAGKFEISRPEISKHLKILNELGRIKRNLKEIIVTNKDVLI